MRAYLSEESPWPARGSREWAAVVLGHGRTDILNPNMFYYLRADYGDGPYGGDAGWVRPASPISADDLREAFFMALGDPAIWPAALSVAEVSRARADKHTRYGGRTMFDEALSTAVGSSLPTVG
ncbi:hypothetical protein C1Y63_09750 [Corynebacterium sp. 13CS0277]|nr:hypothetical protein C1Y63_09750 [Corynebacterium sp. 13CS0277]